MAAPIRFLSGRQQQQKIGIEGNTGNEKVLEVVGRVGIGTTIFEPDSELEVRGDIKVSGIVTANNISVTSGDVNIDQLNVTGIATFGNTIDSNGRIVGAATSNVIPFLYSNFTDLPSAATYHGAFAHVHSTGRAYYAHAGNWFELVNKESTGTVGTGTERFNIGPVDLTTLDVSGISTFAGTADFNGDVDIDGHTELDNVNVSGVATFQSNAYFGDNDILWFGDGVNPGVVGDLQIKSDGDTSYIEERTSALRIYSNDLYLQDYNNAKIYLRAQASGSVELYHNNSKKFETTADGINVSGASTFAGAIDANGGLDVSGGAGLVASSAKISDLTDNRIVIAGASGELEDTSKVTFDGTTLNIVGNATFTGNVSVAGTLTSEDKTNIDSLGIVTARTGVRIDSGGLVVTSGVSTFTDAIDANGGVDATTAKVSDLTSGRVVTAGTGGELQDSSNFTFNGTTLAAPEFSGGGAGITGLTVDQVAGAINGITVREEGSVVGTASSVGSLNFVSSNLTASASGIGATITLTDNPSFTNITATNNISGVNVSASSSVTGTLYGNGSNITGLTVDQVVGAVEGITIRDEGVLVGTANSIGSLNFVGPGISATASGSGSTITVAGFVQDADGNLFAGTNAGGSYDPASGTACFNVSLGCNAGKSIVGGAQNTFLGCYSGGSTTSGSCNVFMGARAGLGNTDGSDNVFLGHDAGCRSTAGCNNVFLGHCAGNCNTGCCNVNIGYAAACLNKDGNSNVFLGPFSGFSVQGADCSVYIGHDAGRTGNAGDAWNPQFNVLIGDKVGYAHTSICNTILIGPRTGWKAGSEHGISIGHEAGMCDSGSCNIALGKSALGGAVVTGNDNISVGRNSGGCLTSGAYNIFFGRDVASGGTVTGANNIILGNCTGYSITNASHNIILGHTAANSATAGSNNIVMGCRAGCSTSAFGAGNVILGTAAARSMTGASNVVIGCEANWIGTGGGCNVLLGKYAGYKNCGEQNVFIGNYAGGKNTGGDYNTFLGYQAGCTNTSGGPNVAIGCQVSLPSATGSCQLAIGNGSNHWITGDSSFNISVNGVTATGVITATDFNSTSDAKLKTNVQVIPDPLDKIVRIDGVSFNWIKDNKPSMGVIADNIQEVLPELVSDTDPKTVNYNGLIGLLIEVVKDQQTQINSLNERLSQLE